MCAAGLVKDDNSPLSLLERPAGPSGVRCQPPQPGLTLCVYVCVLALLHVYTCMCVCACLRVCCRQSQLLTARRKTPAWGAVDFISLSSLSH